MNYAERLSFFESIHQGIEDGRLDHYARAMSHPSGVGRLSHITDDVLSTLLDGIPIRPGMKVLDLGCGRGFLGRWLEWRGLQVHYVGIDFSPSAVESARRNVPRGQVVLGDFQTALELGSFDAVFAIETSGEGMVDADLARAMLGPLADGGVAIATLVSAGRSFQQASEASIEAINALRGEAFVRDFTEAVVPSVRAFYEMVRNDSSMPEAIQESFRSESDLMLRLIHDRSYGYGALIATRAKGELGTSPGSF